ncbi:hypothetical protein GGD64_002084 [Bradyrhizobium sp. CIR3A]|nr:hypothetical protein [Bradyrhizobium sp. CIR3A]
MVKVDLKGIAKTKAKGKTYYYAWRSALKGQPGTPEFMASYNEAIESRKAVSTDKFRSLVVQYKASADYKKLADSTKRNWAPWLDKIALYFRGPPHHPIRSGGQDSPCHSSLAQQVG